MPVNVTLDSSRSEVEQCRISKHLSGIVGQSYSHELLIYAYIVHRYFLKNQRTRNLTGNMSGYMGDCSELVRPYECSGICHL